MTRPGVVDTAPADCWEDAFPVGNGRHGALLWGPPGAERAVVTHHHLAWPDAPAWSPAAFWEVPARRVTLPAGRPVLITRACDG